MTEYLKDIFCEYEFSRSLFPEHVFSQVAFANILLLHLLHFSKIIYQLYNYGKFCKYHTKYTLTHCPRPRCTKVHRGRRGCPRVHPVNILLIFPTPVHFRRFFFHPQWILKIIDATPLTTETLNRLGHPYVMSAKVAKHRRETFTCFQFLR